MPLIGKTPFTRQSPPHGLKPDDYVFFCKTTGEVFSDYEKFFDQSILCNSVIWTCAVTGKTELTFQEAVESEKKALQVVVFPSSLQRPLLFLISLTFRRNVNDITDDIYYFARKRFFISEVVELTTSSGDKKTVLVKEILGGENDEMHNANGILEEASSSAKADDSRSKQEPLLHYDYVVMEAETGNSLTVNTSSLSRKKGTFTKEKCHLFIKQHCCLSDDGIWTIKDKSVKKLHLSSAKFSDFFIGKCPSFSKSPKKKQAVSQNEQSDDDDFAMEKVKKKTKDSHRPRKEQDNDDEKVLLSSRSKEQERQQRKEDLKRKAVEEKEKKREEKHKKKEQKREEEKNLREWNRPRDDLFCEDLKDLPLSMPVKCLSDGFGDALMVLEYLHSFKDAFEIDLPNNLSVATFCESLTDSKVEGLFGNILQQLLQAIFHVEVENRDQKQICGVSLKKLQLDGYSLTEILRLHFLRGQTINGDRGLDSDTSSEFFQKNPSIVQAMSRLSVFDFNAGQKLKILVGLINHLLMFPTSRALIEDNYEELKAAIRSLRIHQSCVQKRERDELQYNARKKLEEKMKEQTKSPDGINNSNGLMNGKLSENGVPQKEENIRKSRKKRSITELCEKDFENMPVENIDWDQLSSDEKKCIKEWSVRKERELLTEAMRLQPTSAIFPIGRDRTYRRYWVFNSVPGIFVEDDEEFVPDCCLVSIKQSRIRTDEKTALRDETHVSVEKQLMERGRIKWSFYWTSQQLDDLISTLNPRGIREGPLRLALMEQKQFLTELVPKCNANFLSNVKEEAEKSKFSCKDSFEVKMEDDQMDDLTRVGSVAESVLEKALREMILDIEERIHFGSLGSLKELTNTRVEWRQEIEKGNFDSLPVKTEINTNGSTNKDDSSIVKEEGEEEEEAGVSEDKIGLCSVVLDLAKAMVQVGKMVEPKYLNPPLGEDEETKKAKQKLTLDVQLPTSSDEQEHSDISSNKESEKSVFDSWVELVLSATSTSQLHVLMSLLETSVTWSKSALHARCRICRRKTDGEHMLLCDGCDRGHHMYCLKPPLKEVPSGDWFCPWCRPKDFVLLPSTSWKKCNEESESDFSESTGNEDEDDDAEINERSGEFDEDEEDARSSTKFNDDLETSVENKEERIDENDDSDEETECIKSLRDSGPSRKSARIVKRKETGSGRKQKLRTEKVEENYPEDDQSSESSKTKRRFKRSSLKENVDSLKKVKEAAVNETIATTPRQSRRTSAPATSDIVSETRQTRGRHSWLNSESVSRGKRKTTWESDDDNFIRSKRKKYSPVKSHFRSSENSLSVCEELVKELMKRDEAWPFLRPVTKRDAADYFDIVEQPMDFQTIQNKIYRYQYLSSFSLLEDIRLVFCNCFLYNKPGTPVHSAGLELESYFNRRGKELNLVSPKASASKQSKRTL